MNRERVKELVSKLTLEEKASLCSGATDWLTTAIERLDIPAGQMNDGPHGLRMPYEDEGRKGTGRRSVCRQSARPRPALTGICCIGLARRWDASARPGTCR